MTDSDESSGATRATRSTDHVGHHEVPRQAGSEDGAHVGLGDRRAVVAREKDRFGGIKWGSALFGWLTATGTAVILTAILTGVGTAVGAATHTTPADGTTQATQMTGTISIIGGIALLVVVLVAYYCGGYVAGRMARFNGIKQGIAVWIWAMLIAVLVTVVAAILGSKFDLLTHLDGLPRIPKNTSDATTGAIIAIVIAVLAALIGAVLGGLAGMRFHRKVDKAGFDY